MCAKMKWTVPLWTDSKTLTYQLGTNQLTLEKSTVTQKTRQTYHSSSPTLKWIQLIIKQISHEVMKRVQSMSQSIALLQAWPRLKHRCSHLWGTLLKNVLKRTKFASQLTISRTSFLTSQWPEDKLYNPLKLLYRLNPNYWILTLINCNRQNYFHLKPNT